MAINYQRETASGPNLPPLVISVLIVLAALFLGVAMAYLVVPFEAGPAWAALMARMWF